MSDIHCILIYKSAFMNFYKVNKSQIKKKKNKKVKSLSKKFSLKRQIHKVFKKNFQKKPYSNTSENTTCLESQNNINYFLQKESSKSESLISKFQFMKIISKQLTNWKTILSKSTHRFTNCNKILLKSSILQKFKILGVKIANLS